MEGINLNTATWACSSLMGLLVVRMTLWYVTHLVRYVSIFGAERERGGTKGESALE